MSEETRAEAERVVDGAASSAARDDNGNLYVTAEFGKLADAIDKALQARDERAARAVWRSVFDIVSNESSYGVRQIVKSLEAAREKDGSGPVDVSQGERG